MNQPVIETINSTKIYNKGKPNEFKALDSVTLKVFPHELVILFGPSGCGKSTLLNVIAGLEPLDKGEVLIRGESLKDKKEDELAFHRGTKIGIVFQQFNLISGVSVLNNIAMPEIFQGKLEKTRINRANELLEKFDLKHLSKKRPPELSGGEQQKIAILRALANNPWIILADEPTGNLDSKSAAEVIKLLVDLNRISKRTILLVTHNLEYHSIAHRVIYMKDGKIIKEEKKRIYRKLRKRKDEIS